MGEREHSLQLSGAARTAAIDAGPEDSAPARPPTWDCLTCGEPWPCAPGKVELAEQGAVHRRSLRLYLESCAIDMIDDCAGGHRASGRDDAIYDRILGWLDASPPALVDRATRRAA